MAKTSNNCAKCPDKASNKCDGNLKDCICKYCPRNLAECLYTKYCRETASVIYFEED